MHPHEDVLAYAFNMCPFHLKLFMQEVEGWKVLDDAGKSCRSDSNSVSALFFLICRFRGRRLAWRESAGSV